MTIAYFIRETKENDYEVTEVIRMDEDKTTLPVMGPEPKLMEVNSENDKDSK